MLAHEVEILNPSATPPFQLDDENLSETVRLEHRILDLRREPMQKNLRLRHRGGAGGARLPRRPRLHRHRDAGALQVDAGGRARLPRALAPHDGHFYALPQSPQLFKQMLMIAGFDRYYQIVKCFRDEDLRADRQPEFTQIDVETSFLERGGDPRADGRAGAPPVQGSARRRNCRTRFR